jgi:myo-inositol-1(or 4)-monophosphatase
MRRASPLRNEEGEALDPDRSRELMGVAADAARDVGDLLRAAFVRGGPARSKRDFHDLVTVHDRMAEDRIVDFLLARVPDSSVLGEEGGRRGTGRVRWHVDPIDGTNNFASQIPFFCVSIAAEEDGSIVAGTVYDPMRSELFTAWDGGAACNGSPIAARGAATERDAVLATDFPAPASASLRLGGKSDLELFGGMVERFGSVRRLGSSALALAYVAAGRVDVTFGLAAKPWDVAAGLFLVSAAGGVCRSFPEGRTDGDRPWSGSGHAAHVADFDYAGSVLGELMPARVPAGGG